MSDGTTVHDIEGESFGEVTVSPRGKLVRLDARSREGTVQLLLDRAAARRLGEALLAAAKGREAPRE